MHSFRWQKASGPAQVKCDSASCMKLEREPAQDKTVPQLERFPPLDQHVVDIAKVHTRVYERWAVEHAYGPWNIIQNVLLKLFLPIASMCSQNFKFKHRTKIKLYVLVLFVSPTSNGTAIAQSRAAGQQSSSLHFSVDADIGRSAVRGGQPVFVLCHRKAKKQPVPQKIQIIIISR